LWQEDFSRSEAMCDYVLRRLGHHRVLLLVVSAALSAMSPACSDNGGHCDQCRDGDWTGSAGSGGNPAAQQQVAQASIDTNETLVTEAGKGAGVFIEYANGGRWHVFAACDSLLSGASREPCAFDVYVSLPAGERYDNVQPENLRAAEGDVIYQQANGMQLLMTTSTEIDGMYFSTPAGAVVRFDVAVGGVQDPRYIYWVGNGGIHSGAPTNPIDLKPTVP
jgi:hypothetical protein